MVHSTTSSMRGASKCSSLSMIMTSCRYSLTARHLGGFCLPSFERKLHNGMSSATLRPSERRPKKEGFVASSQQRTTRPRTSSTASSANSSAAFTSSSHLQTSKPNSRPPSVSSRNRTPVRSHGDAVELSPASHRGTTSRRMMEAEAFGGPHTPPPPQPHLVQTPRHSHHGEHTATPTSTHRQSPTGRLSPNRRGGGATGAHSRHDDPVSKLRLELADADRHAQQQIAESVATSQQLLDNITERRRRAEMLTQLYRDDAHQTAIELANTEEEWKELQERRKHLIELSRSLELQLYQKRKMQQQQQQHSHKNASSRASQPTTSMKGAALLPDNRLHHIAAASGIPMAPPSSSQQSSRAQYEELNRRLDAAKFVSEELTREIHRNEVQETEKSNERTTIASYVMDLRKEVAALEQHEVFVNGVVRESKHVIENAGSMASKIPHMERVLSELITAEKQIRQDFAKTQQHLMGFIRSDDTSIEVLRGVVQSRNGASGALPSLLRQLQIENETLQRFSHVYLEEAEAERATMQQTADQLQQRLLSIEGKTRDLTMQRRP